MSTAQIMLIIVALVVGVANLVCLVYVLVKMYGEKGLLHALVGFFCCQLYPFIWGWIHASRLRMYDVMIFWTIITIFSIVLQVVAQLLVGGGSGLGQF